MDFTHGTKEKLHTKLHTLRENPRKKQERNCFLSCLRYGLFFCAELILANAAERAGPVFGDFFPRRAGGYAIVGVAELGVIDIAADIADVFHS